MIPAQWNIAIIDGQPEVVVDMAGLAEMVKGSPLGVRVALARMRAALGSEHFTQLRDLVAGGGE